MQLTTQQKRKVQQTVLQMWLDIGAEGEGYMLNGVAVTHGDLLKQLAKQGAYEADSSYNTDGTIYSDAVQNMLDELAEGANEVGAEEDEDCESLLQYAQQLVQEGAKLLTED